MERLHSDRSRPYPGRPVRQTIQLPLESIRCGNMPDDLSNQLFDFDRHSFPQFPMFSSFKVYPI